MMWVFAIIIVLVLGGIAAVAAGLGSPMAEVYTDRPDALVPADGPLRAADLRRVRFSVAIRGYRMSEVDALLARLAEEAEQRESTPDAAPDVVPDAPSTVASEAAGQPAADASADEPAADASADEPAAEAPSDAAAEAPSDAAAEAPSDAESEH